MTRDDPTPSDGESLDQDQPVGHLPRSLLIAGVSAAFAEFITFPIDTTKVYLQLQQKISGYDPNVPEELEVGSAHSGMKSGHTHPTYTRGAGSRSGFNTYIECITEIKLNHGVRGFYRGYKPAMLRAALNNAISVTLYKPMRRYLGADSRDCSLSIKVGSGFVTGATTQILAAPTDLLKVRMQADSIRTHPRYHGFLHAMSHIYHKYGLTAFWKGLIPSMLRAGFSVSATLATYDHMKYLLLSSQPLVAIHGGQWHETSAVLHGTCSIVSSFIATLLACPFDVVKTRFQSQSLSDARALYRTPMHCLKSIVAEEGSMVLFRGFLPMYARLAPWQMTFFLVFETLNEQILGCSF